jgi:hypothetical protein
MAHELIGTPKSISTYRSGSLPWHPTGKKFVGAGITKKDIPFSYHADWGSAGRWGIEIMTPQNAYRLIPLEKLFRCPKGSVIWEEVEITQAYAHIKEGIAEQIAVMFQEELEMDIPLMKLNDATYFLKLAEDIFGYCHTEKQNQIDR